MSPSFKTKGPPTLLAEEILFSQGFGTRKECLNLIRDDLVQFRTNDLEDPVSVTLGSAWPLENLHIITPEFSLPYIGALNLIVNKPIGMECSHAPSHHSSVFELLPAPFIRRGIQIAGRLDTDAEGLLLLTENGTLLHDITSPRRHLYKTYELQLALPLTESAQAKLEAGLLLNDKEKPTLPAKIEHLGEKEIRVSICEGKYHQVKRMLGAVGNRVLNLKRVSIGPILLTNDLKLGKWRHLEPSEMDLLSKTLNQA